MRKASLRQVSTVAVLMIVVLAATTLSGCRSADLPVSVGPHTVNDTFVDVNGLKQAPSKVTLSYPTQKAGYNGMQYGNVPSSLDGILYTMSQEAEDNYEVRTTAWDQMTGKKIWSIVGYGVDDQWSAYDAASLYSGGACIDRATGSVKWSSAFPDSKTVFRNMCSAILPDTSKSNPIANRLYAVEAAGQNIENVDQYGRQIRVPNVEDYSGIYVWDASNGKFIDYIKYPTLSTDFGPRISLLYDDGTIYADLCVSTPQDKSIVTTSDGADAVYTDVVAIDTKTLEVTPIGSLVGSPEKLIEQDDRLILLVSSGYANTELKKSIVVLPLDAQQDHNLQQNKLVSTAFSDGTYWYSIAVDNNRVYAANDTGTLVALRLPSLTVVWKRQFAKDDGTKQYYFPSPRLVATRDVLYAYATGGLVFGTDPATGKELWTTNITKVVTPLTNPDNLWLFRAIDNGFLVVMSDEVASICQ
jgi:outer membrane protein assembly factor BamB